MSIEKTLEERGQRYGEFKHHAEIAQKLQDVMRDGEGWDRLAADQKQALTVIADKIARILKGDPTYRDNFHDIVGYAKLVDDRMAKDEADEARPKCVSDGKECFYVDWNSQDIPKGANCVIAALKGEGEKFYAESFSAGSKYWDLNGKEYGRMIMTSSTGWILVCARPSQGVASEPVRVNAPDQEWIDGVCWRKFKKDGRNPAPGQTIMIIGGSERIKMGPIPSSHCNWQADTSITHWRAFNG